MIENADVRLEPLTLDHAAKLAKWVADEDTWTWWLREPPVDESRLRASMQAALANPGKREPYVIYAKGMDDYVGETSYWYSDEGDIEIGSTWMCRAVRGTGFNRKVKALMIEHALTHLGYKRVVLQTDVFNLRSRRAIEKIGGVECKRIQNHKRVWHGRMRTSIFYSVNACID